MRSLAAPIDRHVVSVGAIGRIGHGMTIHKFQRPRPHMVRRQSVICKGDPTGTHHAGDTGHSRCLLKPIIVNKDICSDHQVEQLPFPQLRSLRHDIQIQRVDARGVSKGNCHRAKGHASEPLGHRQRLRRLANDVSKLLPEAHRASALPPGGAPCGSPVMVRLRLSLPLLFCLTRPRLRRNLWVILCKEMRVCR